MSEDFRIVAATKEDSDAILSLYNANRNGAADWDEGYPSRKTIEFDLGREALFVMKDDKGRVIATVSLDEDEEVDKLSIWNQSLMPEGEISRLCVDEAYRSRGIAKRMMLYALSEWKKRGMRGVHILVRKGHSIALKAYSDIGFAIVGEGMYHEKEFICMEIALK